ncbi:unnamed protein product (macronuclear) [Paramecium tetraurelia]|uniref:Uncharacterized protein n=1 Tax=Paramecium tetraurelia TaxID=5888 RepID=A0BD29_PARTE|nr:uncharacterized protein GSPATT00004540001 [Paramecium tetraurelia]CAK56446.1 unnamed protein product [Paramecium tetraurelia]|eukprot:XP_001423844.1 hypothetical protein (macronuclear) [Paramecium tetraurelia strain d4-2]
MSINNKNYLLETFPNYLHTQLDLLAERANNLDKQERIKSIIEYFCELKNLAVALAIKLKTQDGFMLYPKIISDDYIIDFKEIQSCHLRKNEIIYFQAWAFSNLNQIDLYLLQTLLRLQCILVQFECKKYFEIQNVDYKQKYGGDLIKIFLLLQTQSQVYEMKPDSFFLCIIQNCKSKNNQFITYLNKFFKGKNMQKCIGYLEEQKQTQKVSAEKRRKFQQFKDDEISKKESLKDSQYMSQQLSQQISQQISQVVPQTQQTSKTIVRTQSLMINKSNEQSNPISKFQQTSKDIITNSLMRRPSLTTRTIKEGLNHKYKRENEFRQQRQLQQEVSKQNFFYEDARSKKVENVSKRVSTCWNSDCLAPETPELFSD